MPIDALQRGGGEGESDHSRPKLVRRSVGPQTLFDTECLWNSPPSLPKPAQSVASQRPLASPNSNIKTKAKFKRIEIEHKERSKGYIATSNETRNGTSVKK